MSKLIFFILCCTLLLSCGNERNEDTVRFISISNQSVNANHFSNVYNIIPGNSKQCGFIDFRYYQFLDSSKFQIFTQKIYQLKSNKILSDSSYKNRADYVKISQVIVYKFQKNDTFYIYDSKHKIFADTMKSVKEFRVSYLW